MSCHVMYVMSCHVMSCHVMSCHVMLCYVALAPHRCGFEPYQGLLDLLSYPASLRTEISWLYSDLPQPSELERRHTFVMEFSEYMRQKL